MEPRLSVLKTIHFFNCYHIEHHNSKKTRDYNPGSKNTTNFWSYLFLIFFEVSKLLENVKF